jgi:hypothetical protein
MRELPADLLLQATKRHEKGHRHFHKHAEEAGVVVVDTLDGVLKEAGEIINAGIDPTHLVEYVLISYSPIFKLTHIGSESLSCSTASLPKKRQPRPAPRRHRA